MGLLIHYSTYDKEREKGRWVGGTDLVDGAPGHIESHTGLESNLKARFAYLLLREVSGCLVGERKVAFWGGWVGGWVGRKWVACLYT